MLQPPPARFPIRIAKRLARPIHRSLGLALVLLPTLVELAFAQASLTATVGTTVVTGAVPPQQAADSTTYGGYAATARYGSLFAGAVVGIAERGSDDGFTTNARFADRITVSAAGATTPNGFLTARIRILGAPEYSRTAMGPVAQNVNVAYQILRLQGGGSFNVLDGGLLFSTGMVPEEAVLGTMPPPAFVDVDFPFFFDTPSDLGLFLSASAAGSNIISPPSSDGSISGRAEMTLFWDEIVSIRDANDNELLGAASVTSESGTDYGVSQAPPPVPVGSWVGVAVLISAGLAAKRAFA